MKLNLTIDLEVPEWVKKTLRIVVPVAAVAVAGAVIAAPKQWTPGEPLKSLDLNGLSVLTNGTTRFSVGPTLYCGTSPSPTTGAITFNGKNGYAGAKAMCEASAGCGMSPTAHMCDASEIQRSMQVGLSNIPTGWYSSAFYSYYPGTTASSLDCFGWGSATNQYQGPVWSSTPEPGQGTQPWPDIGGCNTMNPVLCCD